jgi:hypothetical protein
MKQQSIVVQSNHALPGVESCEVSAKLCGSMSERGKADVLSVGCDALFRNDHFQPPLDLFCTESLAVPYNPCSFLITNLKEPSTTKDNHCLCAIQEDETQPKQSSSCSVQHSQGESPGLHASIS